MLPTDGFIPISSDLNTSFDHGAVDPRSQRVFVAHTKANTVEVLDGRQRRHECTLTGHLEAAGVVVSDGLVAVTNRSAGSVSLIDATTLSLINTHPTGPRPNGVALAPQLGVTVAACLGDGDRGPTLERINNQSGERWTLPLPGRPRWCVVDPAEERVFCAIQQPSSVLVFGLAEFATQATWPLPSGGAHGVDLDTSGGRLFVACDDGELIALNVATGTVMGQWPLPGVPDATFFNPTTGRVHVAIADPGVVVSVDPASGEAVVTSTEAGAKTTAFGPPDRLYVFLPHRGGALELIDQLA